MSNRAEPLRSPLRARLREATHKEILSAAEDVLAERGVADAGMAEIAARAGVAVGTLYRYFADRDALLRALIEARSAELIARVDQALAASKKQDFGERVARFASAILEHHEAHRALLTIVFDESARMACSARNAGEPLKQRAEVLVRDGVRARDLDAQHASHYAPLLLGMVKGVLMHGARIARERPSARAAVLAKVFLDGARRSR